MAIGALIGLGLLKAATNPETAGTLGGAIASAFSKSGKEYRRQLAMERRRLQRNDFGLSEAQKNQAVAAANRSQQAQARETEAGLRQQAAALGSRSPAAFEAMRGLGTNLASNLAAARGNIEATSAELANQQREAALARLNARRQEIRGQGVEAGKTIATAAGDFESGYRGGIAAGAAKGGAAAGDIATGAKAAAPSQVTYGVPTASRQQEIEEMRRRLAELEASGG